MEERTRADRWKGSGVKHASIIDYLTQELARLEGGFSNDYGFSFNEAVEAAETQLASVKKKREDYLAKTEKRRVEIAAAISVLKADGSAAA